MDLGVIHKKHKDLLLGIGEQFAADANARTSTIEAVDEM